MVKKEKIIIFIVIALALLSVFTFKNNSKIEITEIAQQPEVKSIEKISLNSAFLEIEGEKYSGEIVDGESVYEFMAGLKEDGKINFKDKTYIGMGKFIEEINGIKSNGEKYWIYYVNGEKAKIGISDYKIKGGDVVSWKYEKEVY